MITYVILLYAKFGLMLWNNNFRVIMGNHYGTYHIFLFVYAVSLFCFCFFYSISRYFCAVSLLHDYDHNRNLRIGLFIEQSLMQVILG